MEESKSPNKAIVGLIVVALLVAATTAVIVFTGSAEESSSSSSTQTASSSVSPSTSTTATTSTTDQNASYKDGTYSATGSYQTPGGSESIGVKITLSGGVITDSEVTQEGKTNEAQEYQSAFAAAYKSQVVGKKIGDVSLTRVAGSSLTPNGFNDALSDIEQQAQA